VNAPSSVRTFGRAVSSPDYAAIALSYPGVAKATASLVRRDANLKAIPQPFLQLTIATSDGVPLSQQPEFKGKLRSFLDQRRDPNVPLRIVDFTPVFVDVAIDVEIDDRSPHQATLSNVLAALNPGLNSDGTSGYFGFANLNFGESLHLSAIYAAVQSVPGVSDALITTFRRMDLDAADTTVVRDDIFIRPTEIAVIGNDPKQPSQGLLQIDAKGGFVDT
jgi:hypothetical protein